MSTPWPGAEVWRKLVKLLRLLRTRRYWGPLALGVGASCEHTALLAGLPIRTVIDVGANKGQFALLALHLFPQAVVHAFEPLARPYARLARWSRGEKRLICHPLALGAAARTAVMNVAARDDNSSLLPITPRQTTLFPGTGKVSEEVVTVARLDSILNAAELRTPALLKIDVQGHELPVLEGAGALLEAVDWVFVECSFVELYAGQALADEVSDYLRAASFHPVVVWNLVRDPQGRPVQADLLFRRGDGTASLPPQGDSPVADYPNVLRPG